MSQWITLYICCFIFVDIYLQVNSSKSPILFWTHNNQLLFLLTLMKVTDDQHVAKSSGQLPTFYLIPQQNLTQLIINYSCPLKILFFFLTGFQDTTFSFCPDIFSSLCLFCLYFSDFCYYVLGLHLQSFLFQTHSLEDLISYHVFTYSGNFQISACISLNSSSSLHLLRDIWFCVKDISNLTHPKPNPSFSLQLSSFHNLPISVKGNSILPDAQVKNLRVILDFSLSYTLHENLSANLVGCVF